MEKMYTIDGNYAQIILSKNIYPLVSVKKALSNFLEKIYIKMDEKKDEIVIQIALQEDKEKLEEIIGELYNELLRESLRYNIAVETKNLRELIVGRALYTTCIDLEENQNEIQNNNDNQDNDEIENEDFNLDEIAVNWFDKCEDEEE